MMMMMMTVSCKYEDSMILEALSEQEAVTTLLASMGVANGCTGCTCTARAE